MDSKADRSMNNKTILNTIFILISIIILISTTASADTPGYLQVTSVTMELEGEDATFTIYYDLDIVAKLYVLMLGSGNIEPAIEDIFYDFDNYKVVNIRDNYAVVVAKNVSYKDTEQKGNFYFHDSLSMGVNVEEFYLKFPSGVIRLFTDVSSTPNTFFEQ